MPFRYLGLIFLLWLGPSCLAQAITIRVINADDHRPIGNQSVSVTLLYEKEETIPAKFDRNLDSKTDSNGEARFVLPEPPPAHVDVRVRIEPGRWHCSCLLLAITQDVMNKGTVNSAASADELRRSPDLAKAVPGEIRFIMRPASFFERLLYPLLKQ